MPLPRQKIRNPPPIPPARELLSPKLRDLFFRPGPNGSAEHIPSRYKVPYGGRGASKTWGVTGVAVAMGAIKQLRFLCTREYQSSIKESVHQVLSSRIIDLGLAPYYDVTQEAIRGKIRDADGRRTEYIFAGIRTDPAKVKGTEDIDVCLLEEAEKVSRESWKFLVPTVRNRRGGSEIWAIFNPQDEKDPTYQKFVAHPPPIARVAKLNYYDNPWFPADLELDRQDLLRQIREAADDDERTQLQQDYDHIWEGECQKRTDASVFRRRVVIEPFGDPDPNLQLRLFFGADWGFANDPTALVRMWVTTNEDKSEELWISHEAYGWRVSNDEIPQLFDSVPGSRLWSIKADCARPETIEHVAKFGFSIEAAEKWPGSLEDGIAHVQAFRRIHIHPRCKHLQEEARLYSYKIDRVTGEVLPIVLDKWNHGWDAVRYGLDGFIQRRGAMGVWEGLGK
jgi:phage terminase large subunit